MVVTHVAVEFNTQLAFRKDAGLDDAERQTIVAGTAVRGNQEPAGEVDMAELESDLIVARACNNVEENAAERRIGLRIKPADAQAVVAIAQVGTELEVGRGPRDMSP